MIQISRDWRRGRYCEALGLDPVDRIVPHGLHCSVAPGHLPRSTQQCRNLHVIYLAHFDIQTALLVRIEAIIMSLVFDHALRIRLKAEADEQKHATSDSAPTSAAASDTEGSNTPESGSTHEGDEADTVHSRSVTAASTTTAATSATTDTAATAVAPAAQGKVDGGKDGAKTPPEKEAKAKKGNFMGKVNNLVTSDLDNITGGRNFLFIGATLPLLMLTVFPA